MELLCFFSYPRQLSIILGKKMRPGFNTHSVSGSTTYTYDAREHSAANAPASSQIRITQPKRTLASGVNATGLDDLFVCTVANEVLQSPDLMDAICKLSINFSHLDLDDPYLHDALMANLWSRLENDGKFVNQLESLTAAMIAGRDYSRDEAGNATLLKFTSFVSALCDATVNDFASVADILTQLIAQLESVAKLVPQSYTAPILSPRAANSSSNSFSSSNSSNGKAGQKQQEALAKEQSKKAKKAKKEQEKSDKKADKAQEKSDKKAKKALEASQKAAKRRSMDYRVPQTPVQSLAVSQTGNHYPQTSPYPHHLSTVHNAVPQPGLMQPFSAPAPAFAVPNIAVLNQQGQVISPWGIPASQAFSVPHNGNQAVSPWDTPSGSVAFQPGGNQRS